MPIEALPRAWGSAGGVRGVGTHLKSVCSGRPRPCLGAGEPANEFGGGRHSFVVRGTVACCLEHECQSRRLIRLPQNALTVVSAVICVEG